MDTSITPKDVNHTSPFKSRKPEDSPPGRPLSPGSPNPRKEADDDGRVTKGPVTLQNKAIYTGQWLANIDGSMSRDGFGT